MGFPDSATTGLGLAYLVFRLTMIVFWVVVAWRGLRALEGIEQALRERNGS